MFDIGGFLTSTEFVSQIAMLITTILSTLVTQLLTVFFGGGA